MQLSQLTAFIDELLEIKHYKDACMNGLEIEGHEQVSTVGLAVDGSLEIAEMARAKKVDFLLVHHGIFWGTPFALIGSKRALLKTFLDNNISLYAAHLPLDGHIKLGNAAQIAEFLNLGAPSPFFKHEGSTLGISARNDKDLALKQITAKLSELTGSVGLPFSLEFGPSTPQTIGIVTGAGADALKQCKGSGVDTLITGEPRQFAYHFAKEEGLNLICAGHYATETLGVKAVGAVLAEKFSLRTEFLDCPTGI